MLTDQTVLNASVVKVMYNIDQPTGIFPIATMLNVCPFCCGRGLLTWAADTKKYGVLCCGCPTRFPEIFQTWDDAIAGWSSRKGTASAFGGRATAGKTSRRKSRAAKSNLRKA